MADEAKQSATVRVDWGDAVAAVLKHAQQKREKSGALRPEPCVSIIAVSGPVGAGKSTLARQLSEHVISTDDFLPDYDKVEFHERDLPEMADLELLADILRRLRAGEAVDVPRWSFQEHRRVGVRTLAVSPGSTLVVEGLHALHKRVVCHIDVGVFVEASRDSRWARWERLEQAGERGWGVELAREHFDRVAEPTFARYAEAYRQRADVIVRNDAG